MTLTDFRRMRRQRHRRSWASEILHLHTCLDRVMERHPDREYSIIWGIRISFSELVSLLI